MFRHGGPPVGGLLSAHQADSRRGAGRSRHSGGAVHMADTQLHGVYFHPREGYQEIPHHAHQEVRRKSLVFLLLFLRE